MKRTILAVLMVVLVSVPCVAQDEEPVESIEGTVWSYFYNPGMGRPPIRYVGFYDGHVYSSYDGELGCFRTTEFLPSAYVDLLGIGLFWYKSLCLENIPLVCQWRTGILFPLIKIGIQSCIVIPCLRDDNMVSLVKDKSLPQDFCSQVE